MNDTGLSHTLVYLNSAGLLAFSFFAGVLWTRVNNLMIWVVEFEGIRKDIIRVIEKVDNMSDRLDRLSLRIKEP